MKEQGEQGGESLRLPEGSGVVLSALTERTLDASSRVERIVFDTP